MPDRLVTNLEFIDTTSVLINQAGSLIASRRYRPTSVYDVDPALGSTTVIGFSELAALYGSYRTLKSNIVVEISNLEAFPLIGVVWPSNSDLGANYGQLQAVLASPYSVHGNMSSKGGIDRISLRQNLSTVKFVGSQTAITDDNYRSAVNTIPTSNWYWNIGVWSLTGTNLVSGSAALIRIMMQVEFSQRNPLSA